MMGVDDPVLGDPTLGDASNAVLGTAWQDGGAPSPSSSVPSTPPANGGPAPCTREPDSCPGPSYCNEALRCVPGCKADEDCTGITAAAPRCDRGRHRCVACLDDSECPNGQKCSPAGTCAERCDADGGTCLGQKTCCNGLCLDTLSDELNCGGCGVACAATNGKPSCAAGVCQWSCAPGTAHCQSGNTGCETDVGSDPKNCGQCGNACDARTSLPTACWAGVCTLSACSKFTGDCDGNPDNGCECACGKKNGVGSRCCPGNVCFTGTCQPDGNCN